MSTIATMLRRLPLSMASGQHHERGTTDMEIETSLSIVPIDLQA
jgi:hypothetical protein